MDWGRCGGGDGGGDVEGGGLELKGRGGMRLDEVKRFVEWSWCKNFGKTLLGNAKQCNGKAATVEKKLKNELGPGRLSSDTHFEKEGLQNPSHRI